MTPLTVADTPEMKWWALLLAGAGSRRPFFAALDRFFYGTV